MTSEPNVSRYYDRHILKPPVWTWEIPAYFFLGGTAGASAVLAALARLAGNHRLARSATLAATACIALCPPLLIDDLGRPERFLNMLRVFRPTSPMSVGTWILSLFGGLSSVAAGSELTGVARPLGRLAELAAAGLGPALSTYTAALLAQTSIPAWREARRYLPFLFGAGSAAAAGGLACITTPASAAGPARRLAIGAALAEIAVSKTMERGLGATGEPYRVQAAAPYSRAALLLMVSGAAVLAGLGRRRPGAVAGGALIMAGAAATRFMVWKAGDISAARS